MNVLSVTSVLYATVFGSVGISLRKEIGWFPNLGGCFDQLMASEA
jgi:hypothetical protein